MIPQPQKGWKRKLWNLKLYGWKYKRFASSYRDFTVARYNRIRLVEGIFKDYTDGTYETELIANLGEGVPKKVLAEYVPAKTVEKKLLPLLAILTNIPQIERKRKAKAKGKAYYLPSDFGDMPLIYMHTIDTEILSNEELKEEINQGIYERLPYLLSIALIPEGEDWSMAKAKEHEKKLEYMALTDALGLMRFFFTRLNALSWLIPAYTPNQKRQQKRSLKRQQKALKYLALNRPTSSAGDTQP